MDSEQHKLVKAKDLFLEGLRLYNLELFEEAEDQFLQSLNIIPNRTSTLINLSAAQLKLKKLQQARATIDLALIQSPNDVVVLNQIGLIAYAQSEFDLARKYFTQSIELDPKFSDAYVNLGDLSSALKRFDDALIYYKKAIELTPIDASTYAKLGMIFSELDRLDDALMSYDKAILLKPDYADAYVNRGLILKKVNRLDDALASYDKAILLKPTSAEAYNNRGNLLKELSRADDALLNYNKAIELKPDYAEAYSNRSTVLKDLNRFDDALESYDKAIYLKPDYAEAFSSRGNLLRELNRLEDALASCNQAIALRPDDAEAYNNRGLVLSDLNRLDEALASYDKAITLKPNYPEAYWNRGGIYLLKGQLRKGLEDYEWRKKARKGIKDPYPEASRWSGQHDLKGKRLFIFPELYLGDAIQFCRYALLAEKQGAKVIMATNDSLHALLKTMSPTIEFIPKNSRPEQFDYHCALMSLPFAFKTSMETIPADIPYLKAHPARIEKWKNRIGKDGFKIGICWQGSTLPYSIPMRRSFPLSLLNTVSQISGVRLISLQKSDGIEQLSNLPDGMRVQTLGDDFDSGPDAFLDAAAVMENLDLIISADTAVAHLAGAMGRPTWIALKDVPDWRWFQNQSVSPWYPTMRLFRQTQRDDWLGVFAQIEAELKKVIISNG